MNTPPINILLLVAIADMTIAKLKKENAQLREHCNSFDRLGTAHDDLRRQHGELTNQILELGRQNIALAAEAESAGLLEQALDKANRRIDELEAVLAITRMPEESRANIIALIQEQAA